MLDSTDSLDERLARRRARRWRRRARIAGPLLAVPAVLGLLVLSVDLIEYRPAERPDPAQTRARAASPARSGTARGAMIEPPDAALAVSVVGAPHAGTMPTGTRDGSASAGTAGVTAALGSPLPAWVADSAGPAPR